MIVASRRQCRSVGGTAAIALALLAVAAVAAAPLLAGDALAQAAYDPPLRQHERVLAQAVVCNEGLGLVIKAASGVPACVSPGTMAVLLERGWGSEPTEVPRMPAVDLTDAERAWLASNPIRVSYDPGWPPYEFTNADGEFDGLSAAYKAEFERLIGSDFEVVDSPDWPGALQAVRDGRVDVLFMTGDTPDRREFLGFAPPITTLSTVMITLGDDVAAEDLASINVGTIRGYEVEAWLDENRPEVDYIPLDEGSAFPALQAGNIDVLLWFWEIADYKARLAGIDGLYNAGEMGHSMDVGVAYSLTRPVVAPIIEKAMAAVADIDRERMLNEAVMARPSAEMIAASSMPAAVPDGGPSMDVELDLTAAERAWLSSDPTVRVAYDPDWPPIEFDADGEVAGLSAGYMQMVQIITGAEFVSAPKDSWSEALDSVQTGEADVMFAVARTAERERLMGFTDPHTILPWYIVTASDRVVDAEDLATLRVGTLEGYSVEDWLRENRPEVRFASYAHYAELLADLDTGKIDAFVEVWPVASARAGMSGMQVFQAGKLGASLPLSVGFSNTNPVLGSIITKAVEAVPDDFRESLAANLVPPPMEPTLALTAAEAAWIADNQVVQVAYDPDFAPYEFIDADTGELAGSARAYMDRFAGLMGVQFELVQAGTWSESLEAMRTGDADVMFMVAVAGGERGEFMGFTEPHTSITWDMVAAGEARALEPGDLADLRTGAVRGYAIVQWMAESLPEVRVTEFDDHAAALTALEAGDLDVLVDTWATSWHAAQRAGIDGLYNAGPVGPALDLAVGYSKNNNPVLASILAKALAEIPAEERESIASMAAPPPPPDAVAAAAAGQENGDGENENATDATDADATAAAGADAADADAQEPMLELTDEEAAWVSAGPTVRVAYDPEFEPYEYIDADTGELAGLSRAYMDRFAELVGVQFEPVQAGAWSESLEAMRTGDADVMFMVAETDERKEFMGFTEPHTSPTWDMVVQGGDEGERAMLEAGDLADRKAGAIRGYAIVSWIVDNMPGVGVAEYDDHAAAFAALESGQIDVLLDTWLSAQAAARDAGIEGLYRAGSLDTTLDMRIGYSTTGGDGGAVLGSILAKALAEVPPDERMMLASQLAPAAAAAAPLP